MARSSRAVHQPVPAVVLSAVCPALVLDNSPWPTVTDAQIALEVTYEQLLEQIAMLGDRGEHLIADAVEMAKQLARNFTADMVAVATRVTEELKTFGSWYTTRDTTTT